MLGRTNAGSGGATKVTVVCANSRPTTPRDVTIWVKTTRETTGDWVMQANEPSVNQNGFVWIVTGETSSAGFSMSRKTALMVYPVSAKVRYNNAWERCDGAAYFNHSWHNFRKYYYDYGTSFIDGGWEASGQASMEVITDPTSDNYGAMEFDTPALYNTSHQLRNASAINLSGINTVHLKIKIESINAGLSMYADVSTTTTPTPSPPDSRQLFPDAYEIREYTVDASSVSSGYIVVTHKAEYAVTGTSFVFEIYGD